jgi:tRNA (cytidine/uridine-2'-O-)-methyltransferase
MKVVLVQPQIPQNTGNIVRTCAVTGCDLILVRPLGFSVNDRWLKRAGLDYWEGVKVEMADSIDAVLESAKGRFYFFSSKAKQRYTDVIYQPEDLLIFGSETSGLPPHLFETYPEQFVQIPMLENVRCLNLATSVGIAVYGAWHQLGFK